MPYNENALETQLKNLFGGNCECLFGLFKILDMSNGVIPERITIPKPHRNDPDSWEVLRLQIRVCDIEDYFQQPLRKVLAKQPELLKQNTAALVEHLRQVLLRHKVYYDDALYVQDTIDINEDGTVDEKLLMKKFNRLATAANSIRP